jgi:AcrR family transcriptional regulator
MKLSNMSSTPRDRILDAAKNLFAQYGYQRTSMVDIAKAAGLSRPALYLQFHSKDEVYLALAEAVVSRALNDAQAAWVDGSDFDTNLKNVILAKDLPMYRLLHASPHGAELLAIDAAATERFAKALDEGFAAILANHAQRLADQNRVDLSLFGGAAGFGRRVAVFASGLKHETKTESDYVQALDCLIQIIAHAAVKG